MGDARTFASAARDLEQHCNVSQTQSNEYLWASIYVGERLVAACALLVLSPLLISLAVVIACLSGGSPLIAHRRVGVNDRFIWVYKFRTMWDAETHRKSPRFVEKIIAEVVCDTPKAGTNSKVNCAFARFCREYSLDELPQLWNVVVEELSLVGPRALTSTEFDMHYGGLRSLVLSVKPGITGLWQVRGRSSLSYQQRVEFDVEWVNSRSPGLYFETLLRTIPVLIKAKNSR